VIGVGYESITYRGTVSTHTLPFIETIGQIANVKNYAKFCYATIVPTLHPRGRHNRQRNDICTYLDTKKGKLRNGNENHLQMRIVCIYKALSASAEVKEHA